MTIVTTFNTKLKIVFLFTNLPWPGDIEKLFVLRVKLLPVYRTSGGSTLFYAFYVERQAGKLQVPVLLVFGLTLQGIAQNLPFQYPMPIHSTTHGSRLIS